MNTNSVNAFGGVISAIDASNIPQTAAQSAVNTRVDSARLNFRYGYRTIGSAGSTPTSFDFFRGYTAAKAAVQGYLSVQSGTAYTVDTSIGARTELKSTLGGTVSVGASSYVSFAMAQYGYMVRDTSSPRVYRWTLGTTNSLVALLPPSPPSSAPSVSQLLGSTSTPYSTWNWSGSTALTGIANTNDVSISSGTVTVGHTTSATGAASFEVTIGAAQDWTYNDSFAFLLTLPATITGTAGQYPGSYQGNWSSATAYTIGQSVRGITSSPNDRIFIARAPSTNQVPVAYQTTAYWMDVGPYDVGIHSDGFGRPSWDLPAPTFAIDPSSIKVTFTDNSGGTYTPVSVVVKEYGSRVYAVRCDFEKGSRANWNQIKKVKVAYNVSSAEASNPLYARVLASPITLGGANLLSTSELQSGTTAYNLEVVYSYYNSATQQESGQSTSVIVPYSKGTDVYNIGPLGSWWTLTGTASGDGSVDYLRYYVRAVPQIANGTSSDFKLGGSAANASPAFAFKVGAFDLSTASGVVSSADFSNVVGVASFGSWAVWFRTGGFQNVVHSAIGVPERWPNTSVDRPDDYTRGASYTLSDNGDDDPVAGVRVDDSLIIFGQKRVYAQVASTFVVANLSGASQAGVSPWSMSPPKRIPGLPPLAGKQAFAVIKAQSPLAVYLSSAGELWAVAVSSGFDGNQGYSPAEMSLNVRDRLKTFLLDEQSLSSWSTASVEYDERRDAVWLIVGKRAAVLTRPSLLDGNRQWEFYDYTMASTVAFASYDHEVGMRWMLASGQLAEVERNTSTGAFITGSLRDAGSAPPNAKWRSKDWLSRNLRIDRVGVWRSNNSLAVTARCYAERQTEAISVASGKVYSRFSALTQGSVYSVELEFAETDEYIDRFEIITREAGRRLNR